VSPKGLLRDTCVKKKKIIQNKINQSESNQAVFFILFYFFHIGESADDGNVFYISLSFSETVCIICMENA